MAKGGYKIIDLKNANFTIGGSAIEIKGIYESLEGNYRKPTLLSNIVLSGVERTDRFAIFGIEDGAYVSIVTISEDVDLLKCTITPDDEVTFTLA